MNRCAARWSALVLSLVLLLGSCTTTRVRTYQDPSLSTTPLASVAILPLQNTRLGPQIAIDLNRGIVQALSRSNSSLKIMGPVEAQDKLSSAGLIETYSQFLRDYGTSGLLNKAALAKLGESLGVDAILQGDISQLEQRDGYPYHPAYTRIGFALLNHLVNIRGSTLGEFGDREEGDHSVQQGTRD